MTVHLTESEGRPLKRCTNWASIAAGVAPSKHLASAEKTLQPGMFYTAQRILSPLLGG